MVVNYFVCPCLFDIVSALNYDSINELIKFLNVNYLILGHNGSFYLCCKNSVEFYFDYNKQSDTCSKSDTELISCLDLISYGFEDVCSKCEKLIFDFFLEHLSLIEKRVEKM